MTIRRQPRDSEGIGSLKLLSALDLPTAAEHAAGEADSIDELTRRLAGGARASLDNPSRLHGLRAEAMFRAVLVGRPQTLRPEPRAPITAWRRPRTLDVAEPHLRSCVLASRRRHPGFPVERSRATH